MYLAIDINSERTRVISFSSVGRKIKSSSFFTNKNRDLFLLELSAQLTKFNNNSTSSVVVAVPTFTQKNRRITSTDLPWANKNLLPLLKNLFSCEIFIIRDTDLAALAECTKKGTSLLLSFDSNITLSVSKNGSILQNAPNSCPGKEIYRFGDKNLSWDNLASTTAITNLFPSSIARLKDPCKLDCIAFRLSLGLADLINEYHPDIIVIGGSLTPLVKKLRSPLTNYLKNSIKDPKALPCIYPAKHYPDSTLYGCYLYARYH